MNTMQWVRSWAVLGGWLLTAGAGCSAEQPAVNSCNLPARSLLLTAQDGVLEAQLGEASLQLSTGECLAVQRWTIRIDTSVYPLPGTFRTERTTKDIQGLASVILEAEDGRTFYSAGTGGELQVDPCPPPGAVILLQGDAIVMLDLVSRTGFLFSFKAFVPLDPGAGPLFCAEPEGATEGEGEGSEKEGTEGEGEGTEGEGEGTEGEGEGEGAEGEGEGEGAEGEGEGTGSCTGAAQGPVAIDAARTVQLGLQGLQFRLASGACATVTQGVVRVSGEQALPDTLAAQAWPDGRAAVHLVTDLGTFDSTGAGGDIDFGSCPTPGSLVRISLLDVDLANEQGLHATLRLQDRFPVEASSGQPNCYAMK